MAGGNDERVNLLISAAVDGLKNVEGLISDLQQLEKSGRVELPDNSAALREGLGKTSEEMRGLADRLTELREQQGLVTQFAELKRETKELAEQQQAAKVRATELGRALAQTEEPTRAQAQEFERAKKAAQGADEAWISNNRQLNELRAKMEAAGVSTKDLAGEQVRIRKELDGVNTQASNLTSELTEMGQSAKQAAPATEEVAEATEDLGEKAEKSTGILGKLRSGLKTIAVGATALIASIGTSAATLTIFSRGQASLADELTNTSNAIDANREALQVWQIAGDRVGLSGEKVADILRSVTERLGEFSATGGGEAAQVMEALNLKIEDFQGLRPEEQMLKFAAAIESLPKEQQVALLEKLASDASQLQPLLANNAAGLKAIEEAARAEGAIYTEEELDKLLKANDIYNDITLKIQGLTRRIGAELAPVVADATDKVMDLFDQNEGGQKLIELFKQLTTWGADMATKLVENADSISSGFGTLWDTIQSGASGAMALFRGLQTVVAGFVTLVAAQFAGVLSVAEGVALAMNKVGLISDEAFNSISAKADAARSSVVDLGKQTLEYGRQAAEAGKGVVTAFEPAEQKLKQTEEQTEKAGDALAGLEEKTRKAGEESENAAAKAQRLAKAYSDLGVSSQAELEKAENSARAAFQQISQSGDATKREVSEAFQAYAQAVIDTGDKAKIKTLEVEAANLNLRDALKEVQKQAAGADDAAGGQADDIAARTGNAADEAKRLAAETKNAKLEAEGARETFREALGAAFAKAISNAREQVTALSTAARNLFEMKIGGNAFVNETESAAEALERAQQRTDELASARRRLMSSSLAAWFADTALAASEVEEKFWAQAVAMENLQGKIEGGTFSLSQLNRMSESATDRFDLLDSQRLNGLQSAIESAKQKLESLSDSADNTLSSLRQRLADIRGDTEEAQRIQYDADRKRLEEQLQIATQAGADEAAADYQKSLETLEQIYQIEQKNRREEDNAREKEAADRARDQERAELERQQFQRQKSTTTNQQQSVQSRASQTIILQTPSGERTEIQTSDPDGLLRTLEEAGLRSIS